MKIAIEYHDYEKTFGLGLERSVEEDDMHKFHFIINLWRFVFFIRFIKWHSEEEYWVLRRKEGYMKEIGCYLWCDDEGWHFVFNLWFWDIPLDRQGRNFKSIIKDRILQRRK